MKNIIKKILKEEFDDFEWTSSIDHEKALHDIDFSEMTTEYFTEKRVTFDEDGDELDEEEWIDIPEDELHEMGQMLKYHYSKNGFNDVEIRGERVTLTVGDWSEFSVLFEDSDSNYGYIGKRLAEQILSPEGLYDWEPYYDTWSDFQSEVWDLLNDKTKPEVVEWLKNNAIGDVIYIDGEETVIDEELLNEYLSNFDLLGELVSESTDGVFGELKDIMSRVHDWAYNDAARDEYWKACYDAIKDIFGEGKWVDRQYTKNGVTKTTQDLEFDITDIFWPIVSSYFGEWKIDDMRYDRDHNDFEYGSFVDNLGFMLGEDIWGEQLNPRASEYPDSDEVALQFTERLGEELI